MKSDFRTDINALRAFAVAVVVLYHANATWMGGGFVGVDIFFVISGYLMTKIIIDSYELNGFSILNFYWTRAVRIVPALIFLVAIMLIAGYLFLDPLEYSILGKHAVTSTTFFSNIIYWTESGYFDSSSKLKWLLHTWSLSVEWQFYLIYPILLIFILRYFPDKKKQLFSLLSIVAISFLIASLATEYLKTGKSSSFAFYMLPTRAWEMVAGGSIYFLAQFKRLPTPLIDRVNILAWFLLLGFTLALTTTLPWPGSMTIAPVLAAGFILYANKNYKILSSAPIQYLGKISYSVYLWHWPITVVQDRTLHLHPNIALLSTIVFSLAIGALSYRLIEQPTIKWMKN